MAENRLLLPEGARLLHIGPPKTGTTAIQSALKRARPAMATHGVVFPGKDRQHWRAAQVVLGTRPRHGDPPVDPRCWDRLVRQVAAAGDRRVVVSSERFAAADEEGMLRVVTGLGGARTHVVVTLRPLDMIMPSAWQQTMRQGSCTPYDEWLARVLDGADDGAAAFWHKHRHGELVERWASAVGARNVTVIVLAKSEPSRLARSFEHLLGLPDGLLEAPRLTNPSLTFGEVELVRHVNAEFVRRGWPDERHRALVRRGLIPHLQRSDRPELPGQRITTPPWAVERIGEIAAAEVARLSATGVRTVGDVAALARQPEPTQEADMGPVAAVSSAAVTSAVVGSILAATAKRR